MDTINPSLLRGAQILQLAMRVVDALRLFIQTRKEQMTFGLLLFSGRSDTTQNVNLRAKWAKTAYLGGSAQIIRFAEALRNVDVLRRLH